MTSRETTAGLTDAAIAATVPVGRSDLSAPDWGRATVVVPLADESACVTAYAPIPPESRPTRAAVTRISPVRDLAPPDPAVDGAVDGATGGAPAAANAVVSYCQLPAPAA